MASCAMQPADPKETEKLAKVCGEVAQRSSRILADFARKQSQSLSPAVRDEMGIAKAFMDLYARMAADPALMARMSRSEEHTSELQPPCNLVCRLLLGQKR